MKKGSSKVNFTNKRTLTKITKLVSTGMTEASIAKSYGYSAGHFVELKKTIPELAAAIKEGNQYVEQLVVDKLFQIMLDDTNNKQMTALIFYAKCRMGFNDRQAQEVVIRDKTTSLNFHKD